MKCIRCLNNTAVKVATAPDGSGDWEIYNCEKCNFTWRSTEEDEVINPEKRDKYFQLDNVDIEKITTPIPVPPIKNC